MKRSSIGMREMLVFVLLLGMLGGSWQFGFKKIAENRRTLLNTVEQKQQAVDRVQSTNASVPELEQKLGRLEKSISYFDARLPREKDIQSILESIWQIAQKYGLEAQKIRTLKVEPGSNYHEQPIEISLTGNFPGYYQFLQDLEQLSRITRVSKMNLKKITDESSDMEATMTLSIFFAPDSRLASMQ